MNNIEYNYLFLDNSKVAKYYANNDPNSIVDFQDEKESLQFIQSLAKQLGLTDEYKNLVIEQYRGLKNKNEDIYFTRILPKVTSATFENGILKQGVCMDIANFVKKLCDDCDIACKWILGDTGFMHKWNLIKFEGRWVNVDFTYAMYSRDRYKNYGKISPCSWLGITDERLRQLHPQRKWISLIDENGMIR